MAPINQPFAELLPLSYMHIFMLSPTNLYMDLAGILYITKVILTFTRNPFSLHPPIEKYNNKKNKQCVNIYLT